MILIQSQLCSIDRSDLFIPRSRIKINPTPPPLFSILPDCLLHTKVPLSKGQPPHTCISYIPGKTLLVRSPKPNTECNLSVPFCIIPLFTNTYFSLHRFVFALTHNHPPPYPSSQPLRLVSWQMYSHVKSLKTGDKNPGQTSSPISQGAEAGSHHNG